MVKATPIPQRSRDLVRARDRGRCVRCGIAIHGAGHWHHRRSRSVRDFHTHCPCNGVWLCGTCHSWVHHHPAQAKQEGLIVERSVDDPGTIAIKTPYGWLSHDCGGGWRGAL